jgi:ribosomal protein S18 acetylase RimI-like enzyme
MTSAIRIRPAVADDLAVVLELLGQLHPEASGMPTVEAGRSSWAAMLDQPNRSVLVAELDHEVCGVADLLVVANLTHHARPWSIVENVVVDERSRRLGVGRALMTKVIGAARAAGAYKVQLLSADGREAHAFYRALGFEPRAQGFRRYL